MINNYNRLPIGKYIDICAIYADTSLDDLTKQVKTLSILTDKTEDDILDLPILEYQGMAKEAKFLEASFSIPKDAGRIGRTYNLGKWKLKPVSEIGKMSTAQYVDFQHLSDDPLHHLPELVSVFLVPEGHKYNTGYDIIELQDDIRNTLCVADASSLLAFFFAEIQRLNQGYPTLFQVADQDDKGQEQEGGDGGEDTAGGDEFGRKWGWIANVDGVAETCRCSWDVVWDMPVQEFLNIISYRRDKNEHDKQEIEKWKRTH